MPPNTAPRFQNFQVHGSVPQTHATELDGTIGRGLFKVKIAQELVAVVGKAGAAVTWEVQLELVDPSDGVTVDQYIIGSGASDTKFYTKFGLEIPEGASIKIITSAGTAPKAQLITRLLPERR